MNQRTRITLGGRLDKSDLSTEAAVRLAEEPNQSGLSH